MPTLDTVVTAYLTAVKNSLKTGTDLGSNIRGSALNYLRAQDSATVLDLLMDGLDTGTLTVIAGSTTFVVQDSVGSFVQSQQVGNKLVFKSDTTTVALRNISRTIVDNSHSACTVDSALPATPASGDTYTIVGAMALAASNDLREGKALGDSPAGDVYGDVHQVIDGLNALVRRLGRVAATGVLTLTGNAADTQTVTIDTKVYTFQTSLTDVNGNVLIGGTASDSIDNLIAAINLGSGAGTTYATATTLHPTVWAAVGAGDTMGATAKTPGTGGNAIASTETLGSGSWGAATLAGGVNAGVFTARTQSWPSMITGTGSTTTAVVLNTTNLGTLRIDALRGLTVTISSEDRVIMSNTETTITLKGPLTSAPSASVAVSLRQSDLTSDVRRGRVHPGRSGGENAILSDLINQAQTSVTNYVLPT